MYEFKHYPSGVEIPTVSTPFDFVALQALALFRFVECPKFLTLARHTNLEEVTPLHCIAAITKQQIDLQVPRQGLLCKFDTEGLRFTVLRVVTENKHPCWLVVCEQRRQGFLLSSHVLNKFGNKIVSRRRKLRSRN